MSSISDITFGIRSLNLQDNSETFSPFGCGFDISLPLVGEDSEYDCEPVDVQQLPTDIWSHVILNSDTATLGQLMRTCKAINALVFQCMSPTAASKLVKYHPERFSQIPIDLQQNQAFIKKILCTQPIPFDQCSTFIKWHQDKNPEVLEDIFLNLVASFGFYKPTELVTITDKIAEITSTEKAQQITQYLDALNKKIQNAQLVQSTDFEKIPIVWAYVMAYRNPLLLQYFPEQLKDSYEIVLNAVQSDGFALEFASENLKKNSTIVYQTFMQNSTAGLRHSSQEYNTYKKLGYMMISEFFVKNRRSTLLFSSTFFAERILSNYNVENKHLYVGAIAVAQVIYMLRNP